MLEVIQNYLQKYQDLYRSDGLQAIIISDKDGVPLIKTAENDAPELIMRPSFISPFAMITDQASKLGMGKNKYVVCMYSTNQIIQFDKHPFIMSFIGTEDANTGLLIGLENEFDSILNKLTPVVEASS